MGKKKNQSSQPSRPRNWVAVHAKLRSGAGPHRSSKEYDRSRCPSCDEKLNPQGLCPDCDEEHDRSNDSTGKAGSEDIPNPD